MLNKLESQKGVTFYLDSHDICKDIDIDDDVTSLRFVSSGYNRYCNVSYSLTKINKQFPNITELVIDKYVASIEISNMMFPNVKKVVCEGENFKNCEMLIRVYNPGCNPTMQLYNTFCQDEDFVVDLKGISVIMPYAFEGCKSTEIINYADITRCWKDAFSGSMLLEDKSLYKDGALILGHIFAGIDRTAKSVIIPKEVEIIPEDYDFFGINELVLKSAKAVDILKTHACSNALPETITITDKTFTPVSIMSSRLRGLKVKRINITEENKYYCSVDGVVFTKDKTILIAYPSLRKGHYDIPEGTLSVYPYSFSSSAIESVSFPDSLDNIGDNAFSYCDKLKHIGFNKTIEDFSRYGSDNIFTRCGIEVLDIPGNIKVLGETMFHSCQVKKLILHEGIEIIKCGALSFAYPDVEIELPESLKFVNGSNFSGNKINVVRAKRRTPKGFLENIIESCVPYDNKFIKPYTIKLIITEDGVDYTFYIPRYLDSSKRKELDEFFSTFSPKTADEEMMDTLFDDCVDRMSRQDTALELYELTGKEHYKNALKGSRQSIVNRYFDNMEEEKLISFFKLGFFAKSSLEKFLKQAQMLNMATVSAYLLKEIQKKTPKKSTKLTL